MQEAGTGSHARRTALVESHVDRCKGQMFVKAIDPVVDGLKALNAEISALLERPDKAQFINERDWVRRRRRPACFLTLLQLATRNFLPAAVEILNPRSPPLLQPLAAPVLLCGTSSLVR